MKKILITGASGFIGRPLTESLKKRGFQILQTSRSSGPDKIQWNLEKDYLPIEPLEDLEGVIHLAGENIFSPRWTKSKKERIFLSRVRGTWLLSHALLRVKRPPRFFFSASAVGYYGNRGDEILTEDSRQGSGFLADVCGKWEESSNVLTSRGVRVIYGRFGNVLDPSGGILGRLIPIFKWGLGAQMGDAGQWISWIAREDLIRAIEWAALDHALEGAVNCTSPNPVTQKEWDHFLSELVHRPVFFKVPKPVVRFIFGEMGKELLLSSIRAKPQKLLESGFVFSKPTLSNLLQI